MEKICLFTDSHLGIYKSNDIWHEVVLNLFKEVADTCDRKNIQNIIHLGDFFDNRRALNVKTLNYAHQIGQILDNFNTWIVRGNHDQYFKDKTFPHSLIVFRKYSNIHIIDKPTVLDIFNKKIGLVPWNDNFREELSPDEVPILLGHFDINGFKMNDGFIQRRGKWSKSDFNGYEQVISGHFHTTTDIDEFHYIGSPYQQNFGDAGSERGFYIWSPGDMYNFEFIEFTLAPKYTIIDTETFEDHLDEVEGNIVKIIFRKDYGTNRNNEIIDTMTMKNPLLLYSDFTDAAVSLTEDIIEDETADMKNEKQIVKSYIEKSDMPEGLEKKTIISMFNNLIDGVLEDMK